MKSSDCLFGWYLNLWSAELSADALKPRNVTTWVWNRYFDNLTFNLHLRNRGIQSSKWKMTDDLIQTVQNLPNPYLGSTSFYYGRFAKRYSHIAKPLTDLTKKGYHFIHWGSKRASSIWLAEIILCHSYVAKILMRFDPNQQTYVYTYAQQRCSFGDRRKSRRVLIWSGNF